MTIRNAKKWKNREKNYKVKNGYAQKYRQTVRGIRGVSPEENKKATGKGFAERGGFKPGMKE